MSDACPLMEPTLYAITLCDGIGWLQRFNSIASP
jgi:hypothetical protein